MSDTQELVELLVALADAVGTGRIAPGEHTLTDGWRMNIAPGSATLTAQDGREWTFPL